MIRAGTLADLAAVLLLEQCCATAPHWSLAEYQQIVSGSGGRPRCLFVAEENGVMLGFAVGSLAVGEGELESVAVAMKSRGMGWGKRLVEEVLRWCGETPVRLEVRVGSQNVVRLYTSCGFVPVGKRKAYYAEPIEDALVMMRKPGLARERLDRIDHV